MDSDIEANPNPDHDPVNHPAHYASEAKCSGCGEPIECIDVVRHKPFNIGNAIKYIWRAGKKEDEIQDLKTAVWYLQDQIALLDGEKNPNVHRLSKDMVNRAVGHVVGHVESPEGVEYKIQLNEESFDELKRNSTGVTIENFPAGTCNYFINSACLEHGEKTKYADSEGPHRARLAVDPWRPDNHPNNDKVACEYAFYKNKEDDSLANGYYWCVIHHSQTQHHVSMGANRPCTYNDRTGKSNEQSD